MKKIVYFVAIASAIFSTSCSDDAENTIINDTKVDMTFTIASSESDATRAHIKDMDDASPSVLWDKGDKVTIFEKTHYTSGDPLTCQELSEKGNIGTFKGKSYDGNEYIVVYPSTTDAVVNSDFTDVTFTIPSEQKAINGTFDPEAAIQIGKTKGTGSIDIKHVTAAFYIELDASCNCTSVTIQSANNEAMTGKVTASIASTGTNTINDIISGSNKIKLTDMPANKEGVYMISFIPGIETSAFNLTITYKVGETTEHYNRRFEKPNSNEKFQFTVGNMYSLGKYGMGTGENEGKLVIIE